jgi:PLP dependent protein
MQEFFKQDRIEQDRIEKIKANLQSINERIAAVVKSTGRELDDLTLIAVTKTFPVSDVKILYELGLRNFGENRDQEGRVKAPELASDSIWHFQGQIQSKKLKSIVQWTDVIHSLDEIRHAATLHDLLIKNEGTSRMNIFIQVSLDFLKEVEPTNRGGVKPSELDPFIAQIMEFSALNPIGLMAVAPTGVEPDLAFSKLAQIQQRIQSRYPDIAKLSAGMSNDFESAISHGATHIRIGSQILGDR